MLAMEKAQWNYIVDLRAKRDAGIRMLSIFYGEGKQKFETYLRLKKQAEQFAHFLSKLYQARNGRRSDIIHIQSLVEDSCVPMLVTLTELWMYEVDAHPTLSDYYDPKGKMTDKGFLSEIKKIPSLSRIWTTARDEIELHRELARIPGFEAFLSPTTPSHPPP